MTNKEIMDIAMRQSAIDMNAEVSDFMKDIKSIVDILSEGKNKEISEVKYSQYIKLIDELKSLLT